MLLKKGRERSPNGTIWKGGFHGHSLLLIWFLIFGFSFGLSCYKSVLKKNYQEILFLTHGLFQDLVDNYLFFLFLFLFNPLFGKTPMKFDYFLKLKFYVFLSNDITKSLHFICMFILTSCSSWLNFFFFFWHSFALLFL